MRVAIVSDIHANRSAFEAVVKDIRQAAPDLVLHGGDLADGGSSPCEIIDQLRDLGWKGIVGNTDEMLYRPQSLDDFASKLPALSSMFAAIREMAAATRDALGAERLAWLSRLPTVMNLGPITLVHASPASLWNAPNPDDWDEALTNAYSCLEAPIVVYGHIHLPYVRKVAGRLIANSGSVGMPHDGDRRASYLLIENGIPVIRRVEYDLERELAALNASDLPHAEWVARTLRAAAPQAV
jgi:putative phosphoesterase